MIAFEIAFIMILGVVAVITIAAIGRPLAEMHLEKLKFKYKELGSETEVALRQRVGALEQEMRDVKNQMVSLQEAMDFSKGLIQGPESKVKRLETEQQE